MSENIKVTFDTAEEDLHVNLDAGAIMYGKLKVGTTTTGDAGTSAKVENVGTNVNAILNFTIPKGDKGEQGIQGIQGERGLDGLGVPAGGTTGQVLAKKSGNDNDTEWVDFVNGVKDIPANTNVDEFYEEGVYAWNGDDGKAITGLPATFSGVDIPQCEYILRVTKLSSRTSESGKLMETYEYNFSFAGILLYTQVRTVFTNLETGKKSYMNRSWKKIAMSDENGLVVSSAEPTIETEQSKVWLQKGKNLFNKNGTTIVDEYIDGGTGEIKAYTNGTKMFILEVLPNTTYTISKTQGGHFRVGTTNNYPSVGTIVDGLINNGSATSITITTNSIAKYLCCSYWQTGVDTITEESMRESIQVEQGTTATSYEENARSAIYTKESNNKYEKFSETVAISSHQPINQNGLWLQKGKNLFDKNSSDIILNNYISLDGSVGASTVSSVSGYIEVNENTQYVLDINYVGNYTKRAIFYDKDKKYLNGIEEVSYNSIYTFTTPSGAKYMKIQFVTTEIDNTQLEQGSTIIPKKIYTKNDNGVYEEFINADDLILNQFKINDKNNITDFNSFTKNGFYMINVQKCSNAPNQYATGMLLVFGSYYISQLYIADLNGTTVGYMRISSDKGNTWNNWSQITTKE